ncbi:MAG: hypothetical protein HOC28_01550 [Bacteroidetes Order II. Incertae sedis bacterium]|jgi:hypothetical protein|nr:hypothetical protein [Bacteroidetes Order II. bacterium]MBT4052189.1 hypothetical protein [Bacteroidetes Order II. bacterium]MBT4601796.1 hypothetical protein [Bacteroidetes Order II. bacterium]MBT5250701.1 hypothetical protein [Bacteroidetes Order II. bacterium]MBT6201971.1 hypothetical protein [Bacteroidetes Order II. bacterium]
MRAIFTQLSFLVAVLTTVNLNSDGTTLVVALGWGVILGCMIYLILLVGDYSIHRLLDSSPFALLSARFDEERPEVDLIQDMFVTEEPLSGATAHSDSESLAA